MIVCHMGIGMSHLLEAKIKQIFQGIEIIGCIGKAEVTEYVKDYQVNFIISTVPLDLKTHEYIVISPLFGPEDKRLLNRFLEEQKKKKNERNDSTSLSSFFHDDLTFFTVRGEHRYRVVEMLATSLFQKGFVEKSFIHSAVNRERKSATAIGGGMAIPHGNPEMVTKSAIAVAIMEEQVEWGSEYVSIVLLLAFAKEDQQSIRSAMGQIATLSESPLAQELVHLTRYEDFLHVLAKNQ